MKGEEEGRYGDGDAEGRKIMKGEEERKIW